MLQHCFNLLFALLELTGNAYCSCFKDQRLRSSIWTTVKTKLSDHIKQDIHVYWLFKQAVAYCCMKVVQKAPTFIQQQVITCLRQFPCHLNVWSLTTGLTVSHLHISFLNADNSAGKPLTLSTRQIRDFSVQHVQQIWEIQTSG